MSPCRFTIFVGPTVNPFKLKKIRPERQAEVNQKKPANAKGGSRIGETWGPKSMVLL